MKEAGLRGPLLRLTLRYSSAVTMMMMMPAMMPMGRTGAWVPDRLQFKSGDARGNVQAGLALHADRLQRV